LIQSLKHVNNLKKHCPLNGLPFTSERKNTLSTTRIRRFVCLLILLLGILGAGFLTFIPRNVAHATDFGSPSWWSGPDCDATSYDNTAHKLLTTWSENGLKVCGPGSTGNYESFIGGSSVQEWQCVELVDRYLLLAFGAIPPGGTDGNQVVDHYTSYYPNLFQKVANNGTNHIQVGDVLSYYSPDNHTAIVTDTSNLNGSGTGTITVIEQNADPNGFHTQTVTSWVIKNGKDNDSGNGDTVEYWLTPRAWQTETSPTVSGEYTTLTGVTATATNDVWAVGYNSTSSYSKPYVIHWDGSSWSTKNPTGLPTHSYLMGVSASSSSDEWIAGYDSTGNTLVLYGDGGSSWTTATSANPSPHYVNSLAGVAAFSSTEAYVVGTYMDSATNMKSLIEDCVKSGSPATITCTQVTDTSPSTQNVSGGDNYLTAITTVPSSGLWAVGYNANSGYTPFTLHCSSSCSSSSSWSKYTVSSPPSGTHLQGVTAVSSTKVWAVGYSDSGTFAMHWNDGSSAWVIDDTSAGNLDQSGANDDQLYAVSSHQVSSGGSTYNEVIAVGYYRAHAGGTYFHTPLILSSSETASASPLWIDDPANGLGTNNANELAGVAMTSSESMAVGCYNPDGKCQTLTLHDI